MSTSKVAIVTCWALLLLTMFPLREIAGRHVPATQTTTSQVAVQDVGTRGALGPDDYDTPFRLDSARSRKTMQVGSNSKKPDALNWRDATTRSADSERDESSVESIYGHQRVLVGSSPPTCQGKCGACTPCNPVHVSIGSPHFGALTQQEYYPEVWRCKCGDKLFMP